MIPDDTEQDALAKCEGKRGHDTYNEAQKSTRWVKRKTGRSVVPYLCPYCGKWHTGRPKR